MHEHVSATECGVPVIEEEAVIEKRPVIKEEIVISKEVKTTDRTVEADVRREEVDVKPSSENIRVKDDVKESQR
jgi:stress response protein YsnF